MDLSEYSEEAVKYIDIRIRSAGYTVADLSEALRISTITWYGWRSGNITPAKETWQRVLRVAKRFGVQ